MESTRSEKQEGTHGECCGCEVAHCGSSTPSKHPSSGHSQNNTHITLVLTFPSMGSPLKEGKGWLGVNEETGKTVFEE